METKWAIVILVIALIFVAQQNSSSSGPTPSAAATKGYYEGPTAGTATIVTAPSAPATTPKEKQAPIVPIVRKPHQYPRIFKNLRYIPGYRFIAWANENPSSPAFCNHKGRMKMQAAFDLIETDRPNGITLSDYSPSDDTIVVNFACRDESGRKYGVLTGGSYYAGQAVVRSGRKEPGYVYETKIPVGGTPKVLAFYWNKDLVPV